MVPKASTHITQNEALAFERSQTGRRGYRLPALDVEETPLDELLPADLRRDDDLEGVPELSEPDVVRHFTRISTWNYNIDLGLYPLGSCTMKYNSRLNERVARIRGFANLHPLASEEDAQGALAVMYELQQHLAEITGLPGVSLQPAAGAHGEMTGVMMICAFLDARDGTGEGGAGKEVDASVEGASKEGNAGEEGSRPAGQQRSQRRRVMLIPDSAHGTNPASAHLSGFTVKAIRSTSEGLTDLEHLRELCAAGDVAGLMLTNPNTCGIFERNIKEICDLVHEAGGLVYMDGANMNALVGVARPGDMGVDVIHLNLHKTFSTPHGGGGPGSGPCCCTSELEPFLPAPRVVRGGEGFSLDSDRPQSIGRVKAFYGNFGMHLRALAYILTHGNDGLREATEAAVLNARFISHGLSDTFDQPFASPPMHEVLFTDKRQSRKGVRIA